MSYHIVGLRLVLCDGAQRDRGNSVHVSLDPEILGGQTFLWDIMRGQGRASFPWPLQSCLCFLESLCSNCNQLLSSKTNDA